MPSVPRALKRDEQAFDEFLQSERAEVEVRVFVCGKAIDRSKLAELAANRADKRAYLWSRLQSEVAGCKVVLGEHDFLIEQYGSVFTSNGKTRVNLARFEAALARHVHLVVLFPESPGSFAELGLFSAPNGIAKKLFVIVEKERENSESFLNSFLWRGPIGAVNSDRGYVQFLGYDDLEGIYDAVREVVEEIVEKMTSNRMFRESAL